MSRSLPGTTLHSLKFRSHISNPTVRSSQTIGTACPCRAFNMVSVKMAGSTMPSEPHMRSRQERGAGGNDAARAEPIDRGEPHRGIPERRGLDRDTVFRKEVPKVKPHTLAVFAEHPTRRRSPENLAADRTASAGVHTLAGPFG